MAITPPTSDELAEIAEKYQFRLSRGDAGASPRALGRDQGGWVRLPRAYCGPGGHKPTHGLVPYTGAFPIENTIDHLGPITRTAADAALMLSVIAGRDAWEPRQ